MSRLFSIVYYISFVFLYFTLTVGVSMFLFDYEKDVSDWNLIDNTHKIAYLFYYLLQFPIGNMIEFLTDKIPSIVFMIIVNPIIVAFSMSKVLPIQNKRLRQNIIYFNYGFGFLVGTGCLFYLLAMNSRI